MISKDYKQNKEQVLAIYDSFKKVCEESEKKVSKNIESFAQKIKDDVFKLMVLGEAKSGKSTFINAYLGKEVVPMDVRQCTSAIIEIKSGKEFKLKAKTAAGGETSISGYEKISNFLKTHATISDKYRTIPITTINNEILIKHKGRIPDYTIDSLESINNFFEKLDKANEDFPPASNCWLKSMIKGGLPVLEKKMEEISNFNRIHTALEKFAHFSKYSQLRKFLTNLENEYKRYFGLYSSVLNEAKKNVNDPEILKDRIKTKQVEIHEVYNKINEGIDDINKKFLDNINGEGIIVNEAEKMKTTYEKKLENFKNLPENKINNTTFNSMKIITFDAIDEAKKFRREIANKVIEECNQKLIQYTNDSSMIPADAYSPNFTEADFDTIDDEALKKSSGYNDIQSGITFKKTEKIPFHHLKEHVRLIANSISDRLNDEIIPAMKNNVVTYVQKCIEVYKEQLTLHKNELENEYQKLLDDQKNNNSIIANINDLERKIEIIKKESISVSELKMELKNYVEEQ